MGTFAKTARGIVTVLRRRGIGYVWYFVVGVLWPRAAYRVLWGPSAFSLLRVVFARVGRLRSAPASAATLASAGLLAGGTAAGEPVGVSPADLEAFVNRAHTKLIAGIHRGLDDVVRLSGGALAFATVPRGARVYRCRGVHFQAARDEDRRAVNARFGVSLLTEEVARDSLRSLKARVPIGYRDYAPIDFGCGLTVGAVASTDSGTGRWGFLNGRVVGPLVAGKRVIDLGANNGSLPLMMARAGAAHVTAIERTPEIADFARFNARILAWRDIRAYPIEVITADMRAFFDESLGPFDVVTAFCSLYYLPLPDMARVVARAASTGATLVLQANEAINGLPGKTADLHALMLANGYPAVTVYAPAGFSRPLLVGAGPAGLGGGLPTRRSPATVQGKIGQFT